MDTAEARALARELMDEHGLGEWGFVFDHAKRRAGACRYQRRQISLSRPLTRLHDEEQVRDTVLHEIAHALAGPHAGHGPAWRALARDLGATPERCMPEDAARIPGAWVGTCAAGHTVDRHRRPARVMSCRQCSQRFDPAAIFTWTHHGVPADPGPGYREELARVTGATTTVAEEPVAVGTRVSVRAPGRYDGLVGTVVKRGRTRYHVRRGGTVVTVPFHLVETV